MRKRDTILAAAAIISVAIYAFAGKPDRGSYGKPIAFPFRVEVETDAGAKTTSGIALYDVESGAVKRIYEEEGSGFWMSHVMWREEGKSLIAAGPRTDKTYRVMLVGLDGKAKTIATLPGVGDCGPAPPILMGNELLVGPLERKNEEREHLFFNALVNLDSGKVEERWPSTDSMLSVYRTPKGESFYLRTTRFGENSASFSAFGVFDENGEERDLAVLETSSGGPSAGDMALSPDGTQFAVLDSVLTCTYYRYYDAAIFDLSGNCVKGVSLSEIDLCNIAWLGDSLWFSFFVGASEKEEGDALGFLIASVGSEKKRALRLFDDRDVDDDWGVLLRLRPTMLPDGKTVAVPGFGKPGPDGLPTALVLLDAAEPEKDPLYIPLPLKEGEWLPPAATASTDSAITPAT